MTRAEHNQKWNANRTAEEQVHCNTGGYGELSQYDERCPRCWLGHSHNWTEHDRSVNLHESRQSAQQPTSAAETALSSIETTLAASESALAETLAWCDRQSAPEPPLMEMTPQQESLLYRARCYGNYICDQEETLHASRLVAAGWLAWNHERPRQIDITPAGRAALIAISG